MMPQEKVQKTVLAKTHENSHMNTHCLILQVYGPQWKICLKHKTHTDIFEKQETLDYFGYR